MRADKALLVLGARSGTSALAGTLSLLGCGLPKRLMPASASNPKGHFEPQAIADLHDELFREIGNAWNAPIEIPRSWFETKQCERYAARLIDILQEDFAATTLPLIKEPRICRLLPMWKRILAKLNVQPLVVNIYRKPMEVAQSLKVRDGSSIGQGLLFWSQNLLDAELYSRGCTRTFLSFDELLKDWRTALRRLETEIQTTFPNQQGFEDQSVDLFLEDGLRHHHHTTDSSATGQLPEVAENIHKNVACLRADPTDLSAIEELDKCRAVLGTFLPEASASLLPPPAAGPEEHSASSELPSTGERFIPRLRGAIYLEHVHRYAFASELCRDRLCLDIASGEGFGSHLLAQVASHVWGVDIDEKSIAHAKRKYARKNLSFEVGATTRIPLPDNSVHVVVSFETIEHFTGHHDFLKEIDRVLKDGGLLIISSPDKAEYSDKSGHVNPFHLSELYHSEFHALLKHHFGHVMIGRQGVVAGSYIAPDENGIGAESLMGRFSGTVSGTRYDEGFPSGTYSIAVCSNAELPILKFGIYEDPRSPGQDVVQKAIDFDTTRPELDAAMQVQGRLEAGLKLKDFELATVSQELALNEQRMAFFHQELASKDRQIDAATQISQRQAEQIRQLQINVTHLDRVALSAINWQTNSWFKRAFWIWLPPVRSNDSSNPDPVPSRPTELPEAEPKSLMAEPASAKTPPPSKSESAQTDIQIVAASTLFDGEYYLRVNPDVAQAKVDPLEHYMAFGYLEGRQTSEDFNGGSYLATNPDLAAMKVNPIVHFLLRGRREGRKLYPLQAEVDEVLEKFDFRSKPTILLVCHEGSRTGAPILGYNLASHLLKSFNVVALFLNHGPIIGACRAIGAAVLGPGPDPIATRSFCKPLIAAIVGRAQPRFAIVNSVESRWVIPSLHGLGIPIISLIHEFASHTRPEGAFVDVARNSDVTIFSTALTRDNMLELHEELRGSNFPIIPQGQTFLPRSDEPSYKLAKALRPAEFPQEGILVVGIGTVSIRKGVDLFLDCAARATRLDPKRPLRYVWVGKNVIPEVDAAYLDLLADQMRRAGLEDKVYFTGELQSIESVYRQADVFLLTSRLDPLPNVAIDAFMHGVPVLCFDQTGGIAEVLATHGLDDPCVCRYLDCQEMSEKLLALAVSEELRAEIGRKSREMAVEQFSMSRYVGQLVEIAELQIFHRARTTENVELLAASNLLRPDFIYGTRAEYPAPSSIARDYLDSWRTRGRKPFPGFHPAVYRSHRGLKQQDPLVDFIRSGQPAGPWLLPVITPSTSVSGQCPANAALHIHAYYVDMLPDILKRLSSSLAPLDLLVSVCSEQDRTTALEVLAPFKAGTVDVRLVPNKGRNFGAILTGFGTEIRDKYKIIGHVHTKKSPHVDFAKTQSWVHFLMDNLLGRSEVSMVDVILSAMGDDEGIGMVYPDDPGCNNWDKNRRPATALARRLGLPALPDEFSFPVGAMFWARAGALDAFFDLQLGWEDYPEEPLPIDGTQLHAMERLLPAVVMAAGKKIVVTNVPGVSRN